ncbi:uncharacterized protein LOC142336819 [Convolutriloba macropyga]|uniref:uncharacterized protein LOC142336819 n=1 Tax=Convolutriloba macropyga TaxID=536237 RepID=UPI003F51F32D
MLVALSMDRVVAVWAPIAYFQRAKRSYALVVSIAIPIVAFIISSPTALIVDIEDNYCIARGSEAYIGLLTLVVMLLLPLVTVMVTTLAILCKMRSVANSMAANDDKNENTTNNNAGNSVAVRNKQAEKELQRKKRERDMTMSLLFLSVAFLLNMSVASALVILGTGSYGFEPDVNNLLIVSVEIPLTLNNSINFYLYFLASQTFRDKLSVVIGVVSQKK